MENINFYAEITRNGVAEMQYSSKNQQVMNEALVAIKALALNTVCDEEITNQFEIAKNAAEGQGFFWGYAQAVKDFPPCDMEAVEPLFDHAFQLAQHLMNKLEDEDSEDVVANMAINYALAASVANFLQQIKQKMGW